MPPSKAQRLRQIAPFRVQAIYDDGTTTFDADATLDDIFGVLEELHLGSRGTEPALHFYPTFAIVGPTGDPHPIHSVGLFSIPKKMACGAFSLPFGPPRFGGTCVHSEAGQKLATDPSRFICSGCYAGEGNYQFANQQFIRILRRLWVERSLGEGSFAGQFLDAFALWRSRGRAESSVQANHEFFRIHDSGDMLWGGRGYVEAWKEIAASTADVQFWAPTRDWPSPALRRWLTDRPPNLIVRPSALCVEETPPQVEALDAGTAVALTPARAKVLAEWPCPAYLGAKHETCASVGCRVCWTDSHTTVAYKIHASAALRQAAERFLATSGARENPASRSGGGAYVAAQYAAGMDISDLLELEG